MGSMALQEHFRQPGRAAEIFGDLKDPALVCRVSVEKVRSSLAGVSDKEFVYSNPIASLVSQPVLDSTAE